MQNRVTLDTKTESPSSSKKCTKNMLSSDKKARDIKENSFSSTTLADDYGQADVYSFIRQMIVREGKHGELHLDGQDPLRVQGVNFCFHFLYFELCLLHEITQQSAD